jgi:hypothetical protein
VDDALDAFAGAPLNSFRIIKKGEGLILASLNLGAVGPTAGMRQGRQAAPDFRQNSI